MFALLKTHRRSSGFTMMEAIVVVTVLAVLAAVAVPTLAGVIQRSNDKAHLISLSNIGHAAATNYAGGNNSLTWQEALAQAASESSLASSGDITILAAATLVDPTSGPSSSTNTISWQSVANGGVTTIPGAQLGLASMNPSGTCSMVLVGSTGVIDSWVTGKLGANCTGTQALLGQTASKSAPYIAPSDFGPPHPITLSPTVTQPYDPTTEKISGPTFSFTPSTSGDVASIQVTRDGTQIASLPASSTSYTDETSTPGKTYTYTFTVVDVKGLSSTPKSVTITTKPGALLGGTLSYTVSKGAANATLTWTAPDPSSVITGYHIYRDGTLIDAVIGAATNSVLLPAQGLGTPYDYEVLPYNAAGDGLGFSVTATFIGTATAPTTITATPGDTLTNLIWTPVASTPATPVTGYYLYRSTDSGPYLFLTSIVGQPVTSYSDTGLTNGITYSYEVASFGTAGAGAQSPPSGEVTPITTPAAGTVGTPSLGSSSVTFTLSFPASLAAPVDHLVITRNGSVINSNYPSTATSYTDLSITAGQTYTYTVHSVNDAGSSPTATTSAILTAVAPAAPAIGPPTAGDSQVRVTWTPLVSTTAQPVDGYRLYSSNGNGYTLEAQITGATSSTYTDTNLTNGSSYTYQIESYGSGGTSLRSATSLAVTPIGAPATPVITSSTPTSGGGSITLNFTTASTTANPTSSLIIKRGSTTLATLPASATTYTDSAITNGTPYTYTVTANNSVASTTSLPSTPVTAFAVAAIPAFSSATTSDSQVALSWGEISSTAGSPVDGYRLYRSESSGPYTLLTQLLSATTTSYTDSSVVNGRTYRYQVTAFGAGGESTYSASTLSLAPVGTPADITITSASVPLGGGSATVNFSAISTAANPVTSVTVTRNGIAYKTLAPSATTFTDSTVTNGQTYSYALTAHNALYSSNPTATSALAPFGTAPAPSISSAVASDSQIALGWAQIPSTTEIPVDGYRLYRSASGGAFTLLTQISGASSTSYTDASLTNGSTYAYQLTAYGPGGESVHSASSTTLTPLGAPYPAVVTSALPASGGGSITVNFTTTSTTANPISSITVTRNGATWRTLPSSTLSFTDSTVTNGVAYTYTITTHNPLYDSTPTSTPAVTSYAVAATPSFTTLTPGNTEIQVNWSEVTATTDSPVDGYRLYQSVNGGPYTLLTQLLGESNNSYTDSSLTNGTPYTYQVTAYGSGGESTRSAASAVTTPLGTPATPSITSASAAAGGGSITVNFTTTSTLPAPVANIYITRNGSAYTTLSPGSTNFTDSTVSNGTSYTYQITASNPVATSLPATTSAITPVTSPAAPAFTSTLPSNGSNLVSWSPVVGTAAMPVTGYRLYQSVNGGSYTLISQQSDTSFTDTSVTNGNNYSYRVETYGSGGTSAQTTSTTITPIAPPSLAPALVASPADSQISLTWSSVTSTSAQPVGGYLLQSSPDGSTGWSTIYTGSSTNYNNQTLTNGTTYYYRVAATNTSSGSGVGSYSTVKSATPITIPSSPTGLSATAGISSATVTWTPVTSTAATPVTGYYIYSATPTPSGFTLSQTVTGASTASVVIPLTAGNTYYFEIASYGTAGTSARSSYAPPSGLIAVALPNTPSLATPTTTDSSVGLSWSQFADTGHPVTGYILQRSSTSSTGPWTTIYQGSSLTYSDNTAVNGSTYYYHLAQVNALGTGSYSSAVSATPLGVPQTPTNFSATQGSGQSGPINLSWTPLTSTSAVPVSQYNIYRATSSSGPFTLVTSAAPATTSSITDSTVTLGTTYWYQIVAQGAGGTSAYSSITPTAGITAVGAPTATPTQPTLTPSSTQVVVSWSAVTPTTQRPVTGYVLQRSPNGSSWTTVYSGPLLTFTDTGLTNGSNYYYQVAGSNAAGAGSYSPSGYTTPIAIPITPTGFSATQTNTQVALSWNVVTSTAASPVSGYRIYRSLTQGSGYTLLTTITPSTTTQTWDSAVTLGTTYYYEIESYGTAGTSPRSSETPPSGVVAIGVPNIAPTLTATAGNNQNTLNWSSVTSTAARPVTGYILQRSPTGSGSWSTIYTGSALTYIDPSLTNGTLYYYNVTASNGAGYGYYSPTVSSTPIGIPAAPPSPAAAAGSSQITLTWTALTATSSVPVTGYQIFRSLTYSGSYTLLATVVGASTATYTDSAVTNGQAYYYQMNGYNANGAGATTAIFPAGGATPITTPTSTPTITPTAGSTQNTISWSAVTPTAAQPVTGYKLQYSTSSASGPWTDLYSGSALSYTHTSLTNGTIYYYHAAATNSVGTGTYGVAISATPIGIPSAPLSPSASVTASNQITLTWTALTATAQTPVTGYQIFRAANLAGPYTLLQTIANASASTLNDSTVSSGTTYYYQMNGYNANGAGTSTAIFPAAGLLSLGTPVAAPTITSATPSNAHVALAWTAVTPTTAQPVTGYEVDSSTSPTGPFYYAWNGTTLTASLAGNNGTTYYYVVSATNSLGSGTPSTVASATPLATPATPTSLTATQGNSQINLSWTPVSSTSGAPVAGYNIYRSLTQGSGYTLLQTVVPATTSTLADSASLSLGTTYYYEIESYGAGGTSARSAAATGTVAIGLPTTTTTITPTAASTQVLLSWSQISGTTANPVTGYILQQSATSATGPWSTIYTGTLTSYTSTGLTNGTTYYYQVAATNPAGSGTYSSAVSSIPVAASTAPAAPTATAGNTQVSLTWSALTSTAAVPVDGYRIYQSVSGGAYTLLTQVTGASNTSYTATALTNGTTYAYQLTAYGAGGQSPNSASSATVTPLGAPAVAVIGSNTAANGSITVNFTTTSTTSNPVVDVVVTRNGSAFTTVILPATSFTDNTITDGTAYTYTLTTRNALLSSSPVSTSAITSYTSISAPTSLTATAGNGSNSLSWPALISTTGAPVTGYRVYSSVDAGAYTLLTTQLPASINSYTDTSVTNGHSYTYQISAYNLVGETSRTTSATVTPIAPPTTAPILTPAPADSQVGLSWPAVTSTAAQPVGGYVLQRSLDGSTGWSTIYTGAALSYTNSGLSNGTSYYYRVAAANTSSGNGVGSYSSIISTTPIAIPITPVGLAATQGSSSISLTWTALTSTTSSPVSGYRLYSATTLAGPYTLVSAVVPASTSAYTDTSVTPGVTYWYEIESYGAAGTSTRTAPVPTPGITAISLDTTQPVLTPTVGNTQISLSWSAVTPTAAQPVTGYKLQYSTSSASGPWTDLYSGSALSYTHTSLTNGTIYYYQVAATNSLGVGTYSLVGSAAPVGLPSAPLSPAAAQAFQSISLSWTPLTSTGATPVTGYQIFRSLTYGGSYTLLTTVVGASTATYTDSSVTLGQAYYYQMNGYNVNGAGAITAIFPAGGVVAISTPTTAPTLTVSGANNQNVLSWTAVTSTPDRPVTGYNVQYSSTSSTGPWLSIYNSTSLTFTQTGLTNGTTYWYEVAATNPVFNGPLSTVVTGVPIGVPSTPTSPSATQANGSNTLTWTPLTSTAAVPVTGYQIYRSLTYGGSYTLLTTVIGAATSGYSDSSVTLGQSYYYQINGYNANGAGTISAIFPTSGVVAIGVPTTTSTLSALAGNAQNVLSWTAVTGTAAQPVTAYTLRQSSTSTTGPWTTLYSGPLLTYTDTGLTNGATYYYQLAATNSVGTGTYTSSITSIPAGTPLQVTGTSVTQGSSSLTLNWTALTSTGQLPVTGYHIYRALSSGGAYTLLTTLVGATNATYTDSTGSVGTTYWFQIAGYNANGEGAISTYFPTLGATVALAPSAPVLATPTVVSSTTVTLPITTTTNGSPVTSYSITSNPAISLSYSGTTSPITITGTFAAGISYTFTATATNAIGTSPASSYSAATTPNASSGTGVTVTGGTLTNNGTYYYNTFTSNGTLTISGGSLATVYLVVGGGGGGGGAYGGGGGAGGYRTSSATLTANSYPVTVGSGGAGSAGTPWNVVPGAGGNSSFNSLTAAGGGYGGDYTATPGGNGASGGGGTMGQAGGAVSPAGQGNAGSAGTGSPLQGSGAGGGAGGAASGVNPGPGLQWVNGVTYAAGGGGANQNSVVGQSAPGGAAGIGSNPGGNGVNGTGSGGGGTYNTAGGGNGGSGTVIVRYLMSDVGGTTVTINPPTSPNATQSGTNINITWTAPGGNASGYYLNRAVGSPSGFTLLSQIVPGSATSYTDTTAVLGTTYYYQIQAYNGTNTSTMSSNFPTSGITPIGLPAAPSTINSSPASSTQATVSWTSSSTSANPVTGYILQQSATSASGPWTTVYTGAASSTTINSLTSGSTYYYQLFTTNSLGQSTSAIATSVLVIGTPSAVTGYTATASGSQINLTWSALTSTTATPVTGYHIYRATSTAGPFTVQQVVTGASSASATDSTISAGTTYYYEIDAYNAAGNGSLSTYFPGAGVGVLAVPTTTSTITPTPGNTQNALTWSAVTGTTYQPVTGYKLQYSTSSASGPWTDLYSGAALSYAHTSLTNGTTYYYQVAATNSVGTGTYGAAISSVPSTSTGVTVTGGTITSDGTYAYHTFTSGGSLSVTGGSVAVSYLIVGGGGGGGGYAGGGGGAGGYLAGTTTLSSTSYPVTVGTGGIGGAASGGAPLATSGTSSTFNSLTALGGGAGGTYSNTPASSGGSGGGAMYTGATAAAGTSGQGYAGGLGSGNSGGGGGAGGAGNLVTPGPGVTWVNGTTYAVGGGGTNGSATYGSYPGGISGTTSAGTAGAANTGSGGGGQWTGPGGGAGGSGVVIVRYLLSAAAVVVPATAPSLTPTPGNTQITLNWSAVSAGIFSPVTGYLLQESANGSTGWATIYTGAALTYTDTGLANGTARYYRVAATNSAGTGTYSTTVNSTPAAIPAQVTGTSVTQIPTALTLNWTALTPTVPVPVTGYHIYRALSSPSGFTSVQTIVGSSTTTWTDSAVSIGSTYYYEIAGYNANGEGILSAYFPSSGAVAASAPAAPVLSTPTILGVNSVSIPFTDVTNSAPLTAITFTSSPSIALSSSGTTSPVTVTGTFAVGVNYTFTATTTNALGTSSSSSATSAVQPNNGYPTATGGTLTSDATYYYRTFTSGGTLNISGGNLAVNYLVVGGGGGGGGSYGGGGGAGGYLAGTTTLSSASYPVTVGTGGTAGTTSMSGVGGGNGGNSTFNSLTAIGGGGGGNYYTYPTPGNGGSGGGGAMGGYSGGTGTAGQGYAGSLGTPGPNQATGAGGGAGGAASGITPGAGLAWVNGVTYAKGGGGADMNSNVAGSAPGGVGGAATAGTSGAANTGSGGGGCYFQPGAGAGGSGVVIVRYLRSAVGG